MNGNEQIPPAFIKEQEVYKAPVLRLSSRRGAAIETTTAVRATHYPAQAFQSVLRY